VAEPNWLEYGWDWNSPDDVRAFVDEVLAVHESYENAWESLSVNGGENFYTQWWCPVQEAIKQISSNFSEDDLIESLGHLLAPNGYFQECDEAIFDALLKYVDGFPGKYPGVYQYLELVLPRDQVYTSDWWDFSWNFFEERYFTWTFWGPETLGKNKNVDPAYLERIFLLSFVESSPYKSFRARVALAMNPITPRSILNFLFENRNSADWLVIDPEEDGILLCEDGIYALDESLGELGAMREVALETLSFTYKSEPGGATYMENLFGFPWEASDAKTCLFAAFAQNTGLSKSEYAVLLEDEAPIVRYFLSKNPSIDVETKVLFALENPTFSYIPYNGDPSMAEEVVLN
jgi:hypothetical protein